MAAGVLGIASFVVQLVESVNNVMAFCANVRDAPRHLQELVEEIEVMSTVLSKIGAEEGEEDLSLDKSAIQGSVSLSPIAVKQISAVTAEMSDLQKQIGRRDTGPK